MSEMDVLHRGQTTLVAPKEESKDDDGQHIIDQTVVDVTAQKAFARFWIAFGALPAAMFVAYTGVVIFFIEEDVETLRSMHKRDIGDYFSLLGQMDDKRSARAILLKVLTTSVLLYGVSAMACFLFAKSIQEQVASLVLAHEFGDSSSTTTRSNQSASGQEESIHLSGTKRAHGKVSMMLDSFLYRGSLERSGSFLVNLCFALAALAFMFFGTFAAKMFVVGTMEPQCFNKAIIGATTSTAYEDHSKHLLPELPGRSSDVALPDEIQDWALKTPDGGSWSDVVQLEDGYTFFVSRQRSLFSLSNESFLRKYENARNPRLYVSLANTTKKGEDDLVVLSSDFCWLIEQSRNSTEETKARNTNINDLAVLCYKTGDQGVTRTLLLAESKRKSSHRSGVDMIARDSTLWVRYQEYVNNTEKTAVVISLDINTEERAETRLKMAMEGGSMGATGDPVNEFQSRCWERLSFTSTLTGSLMALLVSAWLYFGPSVPSWVVPVAIAATSLNEKFGMIVHLCLPIVFTSILLVCRLPRYRKDVLLWTTYTILFSPCLVGLRPLDVGDAQTTPSTAFLPFISLSLCFLLSFLIDNVRQAAAVEILSCLLQTWYLVNGAILLQQPMLLAMAFLTFMFGLSYGATGYCLSKLRPYLVVYWNMFWRWFRPGPYAKVGSTTPNQDEEYKRSV